ncbi:hypothetical protein QZH41_014174 [Actinostola sp. cb2023]|nr:hypothetical protein QZH41_014174 [Actinostola sp. cb2023]
MRIFKSRLCCYVGLCKMASKMKSNKENSLAVNSFEADDKRKPLENASKLSRSSAKSHSYKKAMATPKYEASSSTSSAEHHEVTDGSTCSIWTFSDTCEWNDNAFNGRHLWIDSDASANFCYLSDYECVKSGPRKKCTACKIVVHTKCIEQLERINFRCKPTFREIQPKGLQDNYMRHHWVHRRKQEGKCEHCGKSFQHMLSFQSKDIISISCSWCKIAYHNKVECFSMKRIDELCELGIHANLIVPPSWAVKLPRKERKPFVIKPSGTSLKKPLLVFINPKSGGNQGLKIMHKFQWLLNPRQVFDLSRGGPKEGLELYRKVPNLRILACGGDGTVGWVLSELDKLKINPLPAVAILPLGTGNDLSRVLNWGGGYADEPLSKILLHIEEGTVVHLDRWNLDVTPNEKGDIETGSDIAVKLPLNVMNNYFSLGFDAEVCLGFHNWRESHPGKSTSRIKNLMLYGKASSTTFLQGKFKDFFKYTTLECDGVSLTDKLLDIKPLALLFLNISKYGAGTSPWGNPGRDNEFLPQSNEDGLIEVVCFSSSSLAATRVGGHGERIAQCRNAVITTSKTIPMQVDGEPCRLASSRIRISRRNQVDMIQKTKRRGLGSSGSADPIPCPETVKVQIFCVEFKYYEKHCYNTAELRESATILATTTIEPDSDLEQMRAWIERFSTEEEEADVYKCFILCLLATYPDRVYRVDVAQENIYNVVDILDGGVFIVDLKQNTRKSRSSDRSSVVSLPAEIQDPKSSPTSCESENCDDDLTSASAPCTPIQVKIPEAKRNEQLMIEAAKNGDLEKMVDLHQKTVSLSAGDHRGWRPLHYAARHGHKDYQIHHIKRSSMCTGFSGRGKMIVMMMIDDDDSKEYDDDNLDDRDDDD